MWRDHIHTFVMLTVGNEIPTKKPKTTPTVVTTISLMLSLGFLIALQGSIQLMKPSRNSIASKCKIMKKDSVQTKPACNNWEFGHCLV